MKKYIFLCIGTFAVLVGIIWLNDYVLFKGMTTDDLLMSKQFVRMLKICGIETLCTTIGAWIIGMIWFSEPNK